MSFNDPILHLQFNEEEREALYTEVCRRVQQSVKDNEDRNVLLAVWRDQIEGLGQAPSNTSWQQPCELFDSITLESHLTTIAQLTTALHRDPLTAVEAYTKENEDDARVIEEFCSVEANRHDIRGLLYCAAHNASRDPAVPIYCGWKSCEREERGVLYKPKKGAPIPAEERVEGEDYEEIPDLQTVTEEGYDIRIIPLADFFPYPANARSLDQVTLVAERFYVTEDQLWDGVEDYGYSEAAVEDLCAKGPSSSLTDTGEDEYKLNQDQTDGVEEAQGKDGYFELFTVFTRLPRHYGDYRLPKHLRNDWFISVLAPGSGIVLKMEFSPYKECPYYLGYILPKPESLQGYCIPGLLEAIQAEANANLRFTVDSYNITMSPAVKVKESEAARLSKYSLYPGAAVPVKDLDDFIPIEWDRTPIRDGLAYQQWLENRGKAIVSAEGAGQLAGKVRKKDEVQAVEQAANQKFGLYLYNFQRTIVAPLFQRMLQLKLQFGNVDEEDGEEFLSSEGEPQRLTLKALRGKYYFAPVATSMNYSPEARVELDKLIEQIVVGFFQAMSTLPPQFHKPLWHLARKRLTDLGVHNPEAYLGDEPQEQQQAQPTPQGEGATTAPQQGRPGLNGAQPITAPQNGAAAYG